MKVLAGIAFSRRYWSAVRTAESLELGRLANVNPPELLRYDAQGRRLDDVRFHRGTC
ncbi:MAG: hypothetical protein ACLRXB_07750 [Escherichia coli]